MFYGIIGSAHPILIGLLGLRRCGVVIDCAQKTWRWGVAGKALHLDSAEQFVTSLEDVTEVYAVLVGVVSLEPKDNTVVPTELLS